MDYVDLTVWDTEWRDDAYFIAGHVNNRRAIAAVNRYIRTTWGRQDRYDLVGDLRITDISITHRWIGNDPERSGDPEAGLETGPQDPSAEAITEVTF